MLGHKFMHVLPDRFPDRIIIPGILLQDLCQNRVIHQFLHTQFFRITVYIIFQFHHHIGQHLDILLRCHNPYGGNCRILDRIRDLSRHFISGGCYDLTGLHIHGILRQHAPSDSVFQHQLLIKFISAHFGQIVTPRIKEHTVDQARCAVHTERFAGTYLFIQLKHTFLIVRGRIFSDARLDFGLVTEQLDDLFVCAHAKCPDQRRDRHFPCPVHTHIKNIISVRLILEPCTAVRDHRAGI